MLLFAVDGSNDARLQGDITRFADTVQHDLRPTMSVVLPSSSFLLPRLQQVAPSNVDVLTPDELERGDAQCNSKCIDSLITIVPCSSSVSSVINDSIIYYSVMY